MFCACKSAHTNPNVTNAVIYRGLPGLATLYLLVGFQGQLPATAGNIIVVVVVVKYLYSAISAHVMVYRGRNISQASSRVQRHLGKRESPSDPAATAFLKWSSSKWNSWEQRGSCASLDVSKRNLSACLASRHQEFIKQALF